MMTQINNDDLFDLRFRYVLRVLLSIRFDSILLLTNARRQLLVALRAFTNCKQNGETFNQTSHIADIPGP
jgi:hypothetical protein